MTDRLSRSGVWYGDVSPRRPLQTDRLCALAAEIEIARQRVRELSAERKALGLRLLGTGMSEREVGALAGVSGPAVHYWKAGS